MKIMTSQFSQSNDLNSSLNQSTNHFNTSSNNTPPTPKSPFKSIVRANLPNQQRTTVHVRPGQRYKIKNNQ